MFNVGTPYRPIRMSIREDLRIEQQAYRGETHWLVGDPLALEFYRFNEQEFALLSLLDGKRSLDDLKQEFERQHAPFQITHRELSSCLVSFHQKSLLTHAVANQGRHLHRVGKKNVRKKRLQQCANVFALRFGGFNPDRLCKVLASRIGWLLGRPMLAVGTLFIVAVAVFIASHAGELQGKLPAMHEFFTGSNLVFLSITLMLMKVCHEFGHGVACARLGGRCHELGVMLLVFMPTLYVDTSDSWRMKNKWHRMAIAAAGIYVELVLAAVAAIIWWNSSPGALHFACLNVFLIGSVSALVFNGNPLLKFDGYFILSDLIEIPNLQQRSSSCIRNLFLAHGMGIHEGDEDQLPLSTRSWLIGYGLAAFAFRIFLAYWIAQTVIGLARPYGIGDVAKSAAILLIGASVLSPLFSLVKYFWTPGRMSRMDLTRTRVTATIAGIGFAVCCLVPFPDRVACDFIVDAKDGSAVYVRHDAILQNVLTPISTQVAAGQPIAQLRNHEIELEYERQCGKRHRMQQELKSLELANLDSRDGVARQRTVRSELETSNQRIAELDEIRSDMVLKAPRAGRVIPAWRPADKNQQTADLGTWDGWAMDDENQGTLLRRGQPLCVIGDLDDLKVRLILDQRNIRSVKPGQPVKLMFHGMTIPVTSGTLQDVSEASSTRAPASLTSRHGGNLAADQHQSSHEGEIADHYEMRVAAPVFEASMPLPSGVSKVAIGTRGKARVLVGHSVLLTRLLRFVSSAIHYDL